MTTRNGNGPWVRHTDESDLAGSTVQDEPPDADIQEMEHSDPSTLDNPTLALVAEHLVDQEQHLSRRRAVLHARIDFVRSGGTADAAAAAEQLAELEGQERHISQERHAVHARIAEVTAELGRRSGARAGDTAASVGDA